MAGSQIGSEPLDVRKLALQTPPFVDIFEAVFLLILQNNLILTICFTGEGLAMILATAGADKKEKQTSFEEEQQVQMLDGLSGLHFWNLIVLVGIFPAKEREVNMSEDDWQFESLSQGNTAYTASISGQARIPLSHLTCNFCIRSLLMERSLFVVVHGTHSVREAERMALGSILHILLSDEPKAWPVLTKEPESSGRLVWKSLWVAKTSFPIESSASLSQGSFGSSHGVHEGLSAGLSRSLVSTGSNFNFSAAPGGKVRQVRQSLEFLADHAIYEGLPAGLSRSNDLA
ncbi:hypothetical protein ACLOJK_005375 [Asimina triloba]